MKGIRIMIADDHPIIIDGIRSLLSNVPDISIVAEANDGKTAVLRASEVLPDIILMDIELPLLNGFEATAEICRMLPGVRVIALTSYDEKNIVRRMLEAGASGYLLKNVNKSILTEAIRAVNNGERFLSDEISFILARRLPNRNTEASDSSDHPEVPLTTREREILKLLAEGHSNSQIAEILFISPKTVDTHRTNLMQKLDIHHITGLVRYALRHRICD